jgi:apolipoprotein N-acyltransferase
VLRSAFGGLETVSDAQGRILATTSTVGGGMTVTTAQVPLGPGPTLYTRTGDVLPWLCAALSALIWLLTSMPRLAAARWPAASIKRF